MSSEKSKSLDAPMSDLEEEAVAALSDADLEIIDNLLIENLGSKWIKSSFLIGGVMLKVPDDYEEVPDVFYSTRLVELEKQGVIAVKGDLRRMKECEVKLSK